ncbi:pirin family protein [Culicoidibacter larvae]|uniref:Pirin family protein n=1 Tax=Culicoidibacter larvae TaxID=2579976 RepID=A0A5R8QHJ5_9FIRM|nr:pirin family protein [Culicoidibacter larvae]TLG77150.1 pirin family protein [Culicoidibacter larvae]
MIQFIQANEDGFTDIPGRKTIHFFSFEQYFDPDKTGYGVLRVLNDSVIDAGFGLPNHMHRNMEIITYVIEGALSHKDSIQNASTIYRGDVQFISADSGVVHSEYNYGDEPARVLELWVYPNDSVEAPSYGEYCYDWQERVNQWLLFASGIGGKSPVQVHQDINCYATFLEAGRDIDFNVQAGRQAYVVALEGVVVLNDVLFVAHMSAQVSNETLSFHALESSHIVIVEMNEA